MDYDVFNLTTSGKFSAMCVLVVRGGKLQGIQTFDILNYLEQEEAYYTSPAFNGSSVAREEVGFLVSKVLSMQTNNPYADITKAFEEAVANCKSKS